VPRRRASAEARELFKLTRAAGRILQQLDGQQPVAPNLAEAAAEPQQQVAPEAAAVEHQPEGAVALAGPSKPPAQRKVVEGPAVNLKQLRGVEPRNLIITVNQQLRKLPKEEKARILQQQKEEKKAQQDLRIKLERRRLQEARDRLAKHLTLVEGVKGPPVTKPTQEEPSTSSLVDDWFVQDEDWSAQVDAAQENLINLELGDQQEEDDGISLEASDWEEDEFQ